MSAQQLFSPLWYRVADTKPYLKRQTDIRRQEYRGVVWYVLYDSVSNKSQRLSKAGYLLVSLLDGDTTLQAAWERAAELLGDDLPSQGEVIQLLSSLYQTDLLHSDSRPDMDELQSRYETQLKQGLMQRFMNPMALRFRLFDPQKLLDALHLFTDRLFSVPGMLLWVALVGAGLAVLIGNWDEFFDGMADRVMAPGNLVMMAIIFPVVKAFHELGHGAAVRKWGGEVHEVGLMFLVFMPVPYVDASASWAFRNKWHRMVVGAAGIIVELAVAALALVAWSFFEPGVWRAAMYNVVFISGVSTLLFNGNPLLRFDGYYVFADWLEIPNLGKRANAYFAQVCKQRLLGLPPDNQDWGDRRERGWLMFYAVAAFLYRIFISLTIALFVASSFFVIGLLLAAWALTMSLLLPLFKLLRYLATAPELRRSRGRVWTVSLAIGGGAVVFCAVLPLPHLAVAEGVVWIPEDNYVRAEAAGFVAKVHRSAGTGVNAGDALLTLDDPDLQTRRLVLEGRRNARNAEYRARRADDFLEAKIVEQEVIALEREIDRTELELAQLQLRAPVRGEFVLPREADLAGRYVAQGELVGYVITGASPTVRVAVRQQDVADIREQLREVEVRLASHPVVIYAASVAREVPGATNKLPSAALTQAGGGRLPNDPTAKEGNVSFQDVFLFDVDVAMMDVNTLAGERVYVRFDLGYAPLFSQVYSDLRQLWLRLTDV